MYFVIRSHLLLEWQFLFYYLDVGFRRRRSIYRRLARFEAPLGVMYLIGTWGVVSALLVDMSWVWVGMYEPVSSSSMCYASDGLWICLCGIIEHLRVGLIVNATTVHRLGNFLSLEADI